MFSRLGSFLLTASVLVAGVSIAPAAVTVVTNEPTWQTLCSGTHLIDFEAFLGPLTTEYPGLTFAPFNGGVMNATVQFPRTGAHSGFTALGEGGNGGGGWSATFDTPVRGFAMWSGDVQWPGSTVSLYGAGNVLLGTYDIYNTGGGHGPTAYGFNGFASDAADIERVDVAIDAADAVWFDDMVWAESGPAGPVTILPVPDYEFWLGYCGGQMVADFEDFDGPLTTQYPGLTFAGFNGGSPRDAVTFARSGVRSMFTRDESFGQGGGGWSATFDSPVSGVGFWAGDVQFPGTTIAFYDAANTLLGSFDIQASGSGHGATLYGFNGYTASAPAIARIDIAIDEADAVWFDDLHWCLDGATAAAPPLASDARLSVRAPGVVRGDHVATVRYTLPATGPVSLAVYDVTGRRVATLASGTQQAGEHAIAWPRAVAPGVYVVALRAGGAMQRASVIVLR